MSSRYPPIVGIGAGLLFLLAIFLPSPLDAIGMGLAVVIAAPLVLLSLRAIRQSRSTRA